jgi:outer membrane lipoprotein carrier protein
MSRRGRVGRAAALGAVLALAGPVSAAEPTPAAPDCAAAVVARVQARYEGIRSLRARFTQTSQNVGFGDAGGPESEASRGRVEFAKPGMMRFEYETPEPSLVVADGKTLWIYDPTAKEVQVLPVSQQFLSAAAIQFLLGDGRLTESFHVAAKSCAADRAELELRPLEPASYEKMDLVVDPATGWIRETTVVDLLGNRTRVAFQDVEVVDRVDPARFRFEPPPGVRVLTLKEEPR